MGIFPSHSSGLSGGWAAPGPELQLPRRRFLLEVATPKPIVPAETDPPLVDFSRQEIQAQVASRLSDVLLARSRTAIVLLATSCLIFLAARTASGALIEWSAQAVRVANFSGLLLLLALLRNPVPRLRPAAVALTGSCLSLLCCAVVCTIEGDPINAGLATVLVTVSAAAFLPWSFGHQLVLAAVATACLLGNQLALGVLHQTVESITVTTGVLASLSTIFVSSTLERARLRGAINELRRRRAEHFLRQAKQNLEHKVRERTAELHETMQELRAFNYSVSHDLRSPLRSIDGMSQLFQEEYGDRLDETAHAYLARLQQAAGRMGQLIDALLGRSRAGQAEMLREELDLSPLADNILEEHRAADTQRRVEWVSPPHLLVYGDRALLAVVLRHLLDNAWKFTRTRSKTRIELGEVRLSDRREIYVRDNGVGFRMEHAGKLFENFQRLHGDEYEGTGIGLATVARIIARHGGSVRIQSEPEGGTTVFFTLGRSGDRTRAVHF